jgi:hypothetical protein
VTVDTHVFGTFCNPVGTRVHVITIHVLMHPWQRISSLFIIMMKHHSVMVAHCGNFRQTDESDAAATRADVSSSAVGNTLT